MAETPRNPDIAQVIRESLAATKSWEWSDDDRKWSAAGAALKYLQANSTMSNELANGVALKITEEMMWEEAQAAKVRAYNAEMDARNRIIAESIEKPWLPLHDGE